MGHTEIMRIRPCLAYPFFVLALVCCLSCASCGTSHHRVDQGVELNAYKYVMLDDKGDDLMLSMELERMLGGLGFEVVSPYRVQAMPLDERGKALCLEVRVLSQEWSARAQVRLVDYTTGRVVYRGESEYGGGFLEPREQALEAVGRALAGVFESYEGYSPQARKAKDQFLAGEWENIDRSRGDLVRYYDEHGGTLQRVEGIWASWDDAMQVAVFSSLVPGKRDYAGIVLSSDSPAWKIGDVMLNIKRTAHENAYVGKLGWGDKSVSGGTFIIDKNGVLTFRSSDPYSGKNAKVVFIRTYPRHFDAPGHGDSPPMTMGSGFLLDASGLVVTNNHVVERKGRIKVRFSTLEKIYPARVVGRDVRNDLAILRLENAGAMLAGMGPPPFGFARSEDVRVGQEIITAGYPLPTSLGGNCKLTTGVVSALSGPSDEPNTMQVTNPIQPGSSGGAAINRNGNVAGVVVASLNDKFFLNRIGVVPQNVNYCVKVEYLRALASMVPGAAQAMQRHVDLSGLSLEQLFDRIVPYMVQISVYSNRVRNGSGAGELSAHGSLSNQEEPEYGEYQEDRAGREETPATKFEPPAPQAGTSPTQERGGMNRNAGSWSGGGQYGDELPDTGNVRSLKAPSLF